MEDLTCVVNSPAQRGVPPQYHSLYEYTGRARASPNLVSLQSSGPPSRPAQPVGHVSCNGAISERDLWRCGVGAVPQRIQGLRGLLPSGTRHERQNQFVFVTQLQTLFTVHFLTLLSQFFLLFTKSDCEPPGVRSTGRAQFHFR